MPLLCGGRDASKGKFSFVRSFYRKISLRRDRGREVRVGTVTGVGKTKAQLLDEVGALRQQVADLQAELAACKYREVAMREREAHYHALFEQAGDAIMTCTLDGTITAINRGVEVLLGWSRQEVLGHHYSVLVTPTSLAVGQARTRRALAGEQQSLRFEAEMVCKGGRVIVAELQDRFTRNPEGHPIGFQVIYRDVTARKQAEKAVQESEARLRRIVRATNDAVWEWDLVTKEIWWSEGVQTLFGYTPEAVVPDFQWWAEHIHPADRRGEVPGRALAGRIPMVRGVPLSQSRRVLCLRT
jgi:PAS domain S-box-containing protein